MTTKEVMFDTIEDVKQFVNQAEQYKADVDVCCGSCMVDGKSLLGILSLGIKKKLNVVIHD
ncbi:MAG: HPr family phosphocarrier protein [Clostridium sp.]|nr:HPr family phosphocarrier protein [Clostridium sp.]